MTIQELAQMEQRLRDLEERRVEPDMDAETLKLLREWFQGVKRRERRKIVTIEELRARRRK